MAQLGSTKIFGDLIVTGTAKIPTIELGGTLITATAAELNYVDGVTSNIQTQLNAKAPLASPTFTGTVSGITAAMVGALPLAGGTITGNTYINGRITVNNSNPIIGMQETDGRSMFFYLNAGTFHILRGAGINSETWEAYNSQWPLTINIENNDMVAGGNFTAVGNVTAYSDERLKTNVETIPNALTKVLALRGVEFDKDGKHSIGVIAQEVQKIIPEVVLEANDEMKTLSVAYGNMVGLLIEAIKEQQKQIEELKALVGK